MKRRKYKTRRGKLDGMKVQNAAKYIRIGSIEKILEVGEVSGKKIK